MHLTPHPCHPSLLHMQVANQKFADVVLDNYMPNDIMWIQVGWQRLGLMVQVAS